VSARQNAEETHHLRENRQAKLVTNDRGPAHRRRPLTAGHRRAAAGGRRRASARARAGGTFIHVRHGVRGDAFELAPPCARDELDSESRATRRSQRRRRSSAGAPQATIRTAPVVLIAPR